MGKSLNPLNLFRKRQKKDQSDEKQERMTDNETQQKMLDSYGKDFMSETDTPMLDEAAMGSGTQVRSSDRQLEDMDNEELKGAGGLVETAANTVDGLDSKLGSTLWKLSEELCGVSETSSFDVQQLHEQVDETGLDEAGVQRAQESKNTGYAMVSKGVDAIADQLQTQRGKLDLKDPAQADKDAEYGTAIADLRLAATLLRAGAIAALRQDVEQGTAAGHLKATDIIASGGFGTAFAFSYLDMKDRVVGKRNAGKQDLNTGWVDPRNSDLRKEAELQERLPDDKNLVDGAGVMHEAFVGNETKADWAFMEHAQKGDLQGLFGAMDQANVTGVERIELLRYLMKGSFTGLKKLHDSGLMHTDIKGQNIFLGNDGNPKVADLGGAILSGKWGGDTTPSYLGPEGSVQSGKKGEKDSRTVKSDVWAMAEMMLQGLTGKFSDELAGETDKRSWSDVEKAKEGDKQADDPPWRSKLFTQLATDLCVDLDDKDGPAAGLKDLLRDMLTVDQDKRISTEDALKHPFLQMSVAAEKEAREEVQALA